MVSYLSLRQQQRPETAPAFEELLLKISTTVGDICQGLFVTAEGMDGRLPPVFQVRGMQIYDYLCFFLQGNVPAGFEGCRAALLSDRSLSHKHACVTSKNFCARASDLLLCYAGT